MLAPGRASAINRIEEALSKDPDARDPGSGKPLAYPEPDLAPVELEPGMGFWIQLDRDLAGARGETGFIHPDAIESALDRWGIIRAENRDVSKRMLDAIAAGRNQAMSEKIEPEKTKPTKPR